MTDNIASTIARRFTELTDEGAEILALFDGNRLVNVETRAACLSWLLSAVNLLETAMPSTSRYRLEAQRLLPKADASINTELLASVLGILKSAANETKNGLIGTLELQFVGVAFEDFLGHARIYVDQGRKMEAAILASAVLEDTIKRLCRKHGIAEDKGLDSSISALKAGQVLGKVKAERIRSFATLRNKAFHADWEAFDDRDLSQMIDGLEELLENHFATG